MQGIAKKRLKGFEPSTFCMAIRQVSETSREVNMLTCRGFVTARQMACDQQCAWICADMQRFGNFAWEVPGIADGGSIRRRGLPGRSLQTSCRFVATGTRPHSVAERGRLGDAAGRTLPIRRATTRVGIWAPRRVGGGVVAVAGPNAAGRICPEARQRGSGHRAPKRPHRARCWDHQRRHRLGRAH